MRSDPATVLPSRPGAAVRRTAGGGGSDYAALSRQVRSAGLLGPRTGYYTVRIAGTLALLAVGWGAFVLLGDSWWQLIVAAFLGLLFTQVGFLAHDAAHRQICRTRRAGRLLGLVLGNLGIGLSYGWWTDKHNRHHAHPNDIDRDPDVGVGALVFTEGQARRRRGLARWVTRRQAWLFFPMLALEGLNLHIAGVRALPRRTGVHRWTEGALLAAHAGAYLAAVSLVLSPTRALAFIAVQQGVFGVSMGVAFAPNHKGMPLVSGEDDLDYLRRQVLTSRNVRGGRMVDAVLGGLNYQIEHHLFPSMPRPNLPAAQRLVQEFCSRRGIPYRQSSVLGSYAQALHHLHAVGVGLRAVGPRGDVGPVGVSGSE